MSEKYFSCTRCKCFANYHNKCMLLRSRIKGGCPFFQTLEEVQKKEMEIYGELIHTGSYDIEIGGVDVD